MSVNLNWTKLGFEYLPTKCHLRSTWKNAKWTSPRIETKDEIRLSIAATCMHYGQACFEGLKAFRNKNGKIKIFRPEENLKRMNVSADFLHCPRIPKKLYFEMLTKAISENIEYVPPYGSGGSLYIRPLLIGSGPTIGVSPSGEYEFFIMVIPVGPYYKNGLKGVPAIIFDSYDRAAPKGTGHVKVAGNYAAGLHSNITAKTMGYPIVLYLDAQTRTCIDEFGTSNFIAIDKNASYLTPKSTTILPSITNKSLTTLAKDMGIKVERRTIRVEELSNFVEIGACGTAVVITPVESIKYNDREWKFPNSDNGLLKKLHDRLLRIQFGEEKDKFDWLVECP